MQQVTLPQSNDRPITFTGRQLGAVEARHVQSKQGRSYHTLALYETEHHGWVVSVAYETTYSGDTERRSVLIGDDQAQLAGHLDSYDAGEDKSGWPEGAQFDRKRQHVTSLLRRNFRAAVDQLLVHLPATAIALPPRSWRCDACGESIDAVDEGWVEWLTPAAGGVGHGLRVVHHRSVSEGCQYSDAPDHVVADGHLNEYLGPDGLMQLIGLADSGQLPAAEVSEMLKRLHVPLYEAARPHLKTAEAEGLVDLGMAPGCYSQAQLLAILRAREGGGCSS